MRKNGVAIVAVGFPATPILEGRIRFCMSASHTKEMLDHVLQAFAQVGGDILLRVSRLLPYKGEIIYEDVDQEVKFLE
ncbi:unnamed protein product [Allacma fusca]|uniref:Aminotransferase class I/classII domain-containing protein n=1 Tax=Allacma fusca TaxID=39272 RepID=A0A8J2L5I3_9HEXA|nr:unnamed protein product [Allacma fusca]